MTGTFSRHDGCHIHISLADAEGIVIGGHLIDSTVFRTCEVVLGTADEVEFVTEMDEFVREMNDETGYRELVPLQLQHNVIRLTTVMIQATIHLYDHWCKVAS